MTFQEMYRCYDYKKPKNEKILKGYFLNIRKIEEGEQEERFISLLDLDTFDDSHDWLYEELKPYIEKLDNELFESLREKFPWQAQQLMEIPYDEKYEEFKNVLKM